MDVLVVGSGGREYELGRQLGLSAKVSKVYFAPGNGGTAAMDKGENVPVGPTEADAIVAFVKEKNIGLTVLGPDAAVAAGVGDALRRAGALVFGPTRKAGLLEASKIFASDFMARHSIPHPGSWAAHSLDEALHIIRDKDPESIVLKADGLAAGKGVVLPGSREEAEQTLRNMFAGMGFEGAGKDMVQIQERLHGPEASAFAISDGKRVLILPFSQDHKRLNDGDEGPNTGGMGVYCPVPQSIISGGVAAKIEAIAQQTIDGMAAEGTPYQGVLYIGLMFPEERGGNPVVIEYNARFGDPETEAVMPVLQSSGCDLADVLLRAAKGDISTMELPKVTGAVLTVALAAEGYPESPRKGDEIFGLDTSYDGVVVQHAGTKQEHGTWLTAGGRVVYVTGVGDTVAEAASRAYAAIGDHGIHFAGMQYRTDIGYQARS